MAKLTEKQLFEMFPDLRGLRQLRKTFGNERASKAEYQKKRRELCDFAQAHNLVIHPGKGYDYYIESFFMFNCCPCDKTRLACPCEQVIEEVAREGRCKCRLFWRSYNDFKETMIKEIEGGESETDRG